LIVVTIEWECWVSRWLCCVSCWLNPMAGIGNIFECTRHPAPEKGTTKVNNENQSYFP
jgi:hypothetical protein